MPVFASSGPGALVVYEAPDRRVGQRRVADHQLARREVAWIGAVDARAAAKERDLKAVPQRAGRRGFMQGTGDVPPLGAQLGMRAVVAREGQRTRRKRQRAGGVQQHGQARKAGQQGAAPNVVVHDPTV